MNARLNFNELLKLYEQGMRKKEIQRVTHITDNEYICFLNATQKKRAAIKHKDKQDKHLIRSSSVYALARQGYAIGEIAEALHLTLDECRKKYHEEREQRKRERAAKSKT